MAGADLRLLEINTRSKQFAPIRNLVSNVVSAYAFTNTAGKAAFPIGCVQYATIALGLPMRLDAGLSRLSKFLRPRVTFPSVEFEFRLSSPRVLAALWPVVIKARLPISQHPLSPVLIYHQGISSSILSFLSAGIYPLPLSIEC